MKIYIKESEKPKCCQECNICAAGCPLKSLEEHDKEVREQAIKEFEEKFNDNLNKDMPTCWEYNSVAKQLIKIFDKTMEEMTK